MNKMIQKLNIIKKKLPFKIYKFKNVKSDLKKDNEIIIESESSPKQVKIRNPGVDFGRILAMLGIIIHHILLHGHGLKKYRKYPNLNKLNTSLFGMLVLIFLYQDM